MVEVENIRAVNQRVRQAGQLLAVLRPCAETDVSQFVKNIIASQTQTPDPVLIIDCNAGEALEQLGYGSDYGLADVTTGNINIEAAISVNANTSYHMIAADPSDLNAALGTIAALSLKYGLVIVLAPPGCTHVHVKLASAADMSLLCFQTEDDRYMRAYWLLDAVRRRYAGFDPLLVSNGTIGDAQEIATVLRTAVKDFLGAAPDYVGHLTHAKTAQMILRHMAETQTIANVA